MTFVQANPLQHLAQTDGKQYTTAVLAHSIWYFSSPSVLSATLSALATRVQRICIAEYALSSADLQAAPHVLAALAQAALECRKPISTSNIRTVLSPAVLRTHALEAGLKLIQERTIVPPPGMLDGYWESYHVLSDAFTQDIEQNVKDEREKSVVIAMRDAVVAAKRIVTEKGFEQVHTMDVWVASFTKL